MGGSHSSKQVSDVLNEIVQQVMQNVMQSHTTDIQNVQDVYQVNRFVQGATSTIDCRPDKFELNQLNDSIFDFKYVDNITNDITTDIKAKLTQDITNKQKQVQKIVRDMTIGGSTDDQQISNIINRVNQLVNSNVNVQTMNRILRQTTSIQGNDIVINGNIFGDGCKITQANKLQFHLMANSLTNTITKTIMDDEVLGRVINDISQSQEIVQLGVTTMISAMASLILAIGACISMAGTGVGGPVMSLVFKIFVVILCIFLIYLPFAYWREWWPFRHGHWGCERDSDGLVTGKCIQISKDDPQVDTKGPYPDEKACNNAISDGKACPQYWGCTVEPETKILRQTCAKYKSPFVPDSYSGAPYKSEIACQSDQNRCKTTWRCGVDKDGYATGKCAEFNRDVFPGEGIVEKAKCERTISDCSQIWSCTKHKDNKCVCEQYPYGTIAENPYPDKGKCDLDCPSNCKR